MQSNWMPMIRIAFPSAIALTAGACALGGHGARGVESAPCADDARHTPVVVADAEEDLWPDPVTRTEVRLSDLQHHLREYVRATGGLPGSLRELVPPDGPPGEAGRDAWGNVITFLRLPQDYELRAHGPDGVAGAPDDIVASRDSVLPHPRPEPERTTRARLGILQTLVTGYERREGSLPERLEDTPAAGVLPDAWRVDGWDRPVEYARRDDTFEVRSAGPDGRFRTGDDLVVQDRLPIGEPACAS